MDARLLFRFLQPRQKKKKNKMLCTHQVSYKPTPSMEKIYIHIHQFKVHLTSS